MNLWDALLTLAVAAVLALAVALCVRRKTRGDSCCGGGNCARCRERRENEKKNTDI